MTNEDAILQPVGFQGELRLLGWQRMIRSSSLPPVMSGHRSSQHGYEYCSGLPIAIDATQSGIQHYAAASLNPARRQLVNLAKDLTRAE